MADLNPLKFAVAIQDEATSQLGKIEKEFEKLKDKTISVKVEGLQDLQNLLSALQHKQVETLGKDVAAGIHDAAKGLQEEAQKAVRASLGQLAQDLVAVKTAIQHDNFTAFSTRIEKCAQAVNTLDAAFKQFHVTIGADAGMRNFMTGLGEVIRNVRTTMGTLEVSKGGDSVLGSFANTYARNVERMEDALFRLQEARAKVFNAIKGAEGAGMDSNIISRWRIYLQVLDAYEKKLQNIKNDDTLMNGRGWQTNAFGTTFKHLLSNASDFEKAANVFIRAQEKLSAAQEKATGMNAGAAAQSGVSLFSGQNTEEIRKQIDAVGALYTQIQKLENELGRAGMAMQTISPTKWDELLRSGLYQKGVSYEAQMAKLRSEQIYPGDMKQQAEIIRENIERLRSLIAVFKEGGYDVKGYEQQLNALLVTCEKFAALQPVDLGKKLGLEHVKGYTGPSSAATDVQWAAMKHQAEVQEVAGEAAKRHQRKLEELTNAFAQHDAQVAKSQRVQDGENKARQESAAALRKQAQELVKARMEMLRTQSTDLGKLLSMGRGTLGSEQYDAVRNALRSVREEMRQIEVVMQRMDSYSTRSLFSIGRGTTPDYAPLVSSTQKLIAAKEQATQASNQMTAAEQRLAQALNQTTESARGQSQVLADLKSMATQYLGVWGGQQFLHNIIEIGGQLEMQRLSIGAILQNTAQANELFDKIKHLATQSPFGVVQLDQMTKQLTAYGFKYNELYDMTKRLADISAATGTDVSRLALALGHVRSEAALSGYTLRQFSMANVPLLQKLSEKLGKTTKEIREMVKKKEVGYDDVIGVLKDLTNEGGMFYNMQEVISESVKAKFKNVKDAMDIMYGEMAEGAPGDALKEVANVLMELTQNWKDVATVMGTGTAMWALHRVAVIANIAVLGQHNAATLKNIAAFRAQEAQQLRTASIYRVLSAAEQQQIAISKRLTTIERTRLALGGSLSSSRMRNLALGRQQQVMDLALALSSKKLTTEDIARQVALGKLSKAQARQILNLADLTAAERIAGIEAVNNTKRFGALRVVAATAANGVMRLATAFKSFVVAATPMIAISAIAELWMRNKQEMERAEELADKIREHSNSAMQATRGIMESSQMKFENANGEEVSPSQLDFQSIPTIKAKMEVEFDREEAQQLIDEWSNYIRQYSATPNKILNEALFNGDEERSLEEQFTNLLNIIGEVVKAQYGLHDMGDIFENATKATDGGWLNDDIVTNINDYENAVKDYNRAFADLYREHGRGVDKIVKSVEKENNAFATAVSGMGTYAEKFKYLIENMGDYEGAYDTARNSIQYDDQDLYSFLYDSQYGNFDEKGEKNWAKNNMNEDLETFFNHIEAELNNRGQKIGSLTKAQQQDLLLGFTQFLSSTKATSQETLDYLQKRFAERFQLELDVKDEKFKPKIDKIKKMLQDLSGSKWETELKFGSNVKDVIDEARKQYKAAKEYFEKVKPIMLKLGVEFEMGKELTQEQIEAAVAKAGANETDPAKKKAAQDFARQALQGVNEATRVYNQAMNASKTGGFSLEDPKKTKGGSKAYKDEFAKRWDERIRIMKEAYSWYEKWEKKVGNDSAIEETNSKYGDIFGEWKTDKVLPMDFDVNQIADYQRYVEKIRDDALKRYQSQKNDKSKKNGEEALRVYRQAVALLNDINFDNFGRAAEEFKSVIEQTLDDLTRRWDIYNNVREATGSDALAMSMSGFDKTKHGTHANAVRSEIENQLSSLGISVDFDVNLDKKKVEEKFKNLIPDTAQEKIDGFVKAYLQWQNLEKQQQFSDIQNYAKWLGGLVDLESARVKLQNEYNKALEETNRLLAAGIITEEEAERRRISAQVAQETKGKDEMAWYYNLYNNSQVMAKKEFAVAYDHEMQNLDDQLSTHQITLQQYIDKVSKLNQISAEFDASGYLGIKGGAGSFLSGGVNGLLDYYKKKSNEAKSKGDNDSAKKWYKKYSSLNKLQEESERVAKSFQDLSDVSNMLANMFDALGMEGASNAFSDAGSVLGGVSSGAQSLSAFGAVGMLAGGIIGGLTSIFQLHDKRLERQIEKLREDVQDIEANTELIVKSRERTLGYDMGDVRRSYANQYAPDESLKSVFEFNNIQEYKEFLRYGGEGFSSNARKDMYEYYSKNTSGTGYQQEYRNLLDERKKYLEILEKEEEKKKKSQSDIDETMAKINELDDQIMYFTQDLAKELWNIDIKGWADQINDALMTAFENGENAMDAFEDAAKSIMQSITSQIMKMAIIEPLMENLQETLFGKIDEKTGKRNGGAIDPTEALKDPGSYGKKVGGITAEWLKGAQETITTAGAELYYSLENLMNQMGWSLGNDSSKTLSASVQGTSEETSGLLAGYVNALRQDVAANRLLFTQFVTQLWPEYVTSFSNSVTAITNIDTNVRVVMEMMRDGRGAMYEEIHSLRSRIDNVVDGIEHFTIR